MNAEGRRLLIISAGMGAGHDAVAAELARRLARLGADVQVVDVLHLLPLRLGRLLRGSYHWMIRRAPWLYEVIYRVFFVAKRAPTVSPLTALAGSRLLRLVARRPPDEVISTFHVAAQVAGALRRRGRLAATSTVLVTDFAVHRLWLHPGNDRYLCPNPATVPRVAALTGRPVSAHAPVVRPAFLGCGGRTGAAVRARIGAAPGDRLVLISSGSWGVGDIAETARIVARSGRYVPVVLCGRNAELRRRLAGLPAGLVLGWQEDMPALMAQAHALVDNGAGLTCEEAFAAGLPVVSYRPIPGHGRDGALAMARAEVTVHAPDAAALVRALAQLEDVRRRERLVSRASALFHAEPAEAVLLSAPLRR
ncbi:glycosyltransferase [Nonomuraea sp. MCN248]|uniref:Glycosyltransferase n=1 Tax=Nonomuraea corallina TaxID=2989783 RepID=A0ABT4SJT7_9ACTN|nr:glycosyltransferase [Nonomuraea corallina]MDA0637486.1 glycosyltransferase [Nonomuraea corallina]